MYCNDIYVIEVPVPVFKSGACVYLGIVYQEV